MVWMKTQKKSESEPEHQTTGKEKSNRLIERKEDGFQVYQYMELKVGTNE